MNNIWVVIAAYNEEKIIADTVANVFTHITNVIVVDDCSIDATTQKAVDAGAYVLRHPINLGQGAALQT
ncbi:MAG: glycosyltransferase, partial [Methylococcales bacterium]|nr:glycosyltransferase [Methylococcales bacterium]